jgi:Ni,Fe-hydrogenase I cytochrome b subunit
LKKRHKHNKEDKAVLLFEQTLFSAGLEVERLWTRNAIASCSCRVRVRAYLEIVSTEEGRSKKWKEIKWVLIISSEPYSKLYLNPVS